MGQPSITLTQATHKHPDFYLFFGTKSSILQWQAIDEQPSLSNTSCVKRKSKKKSTDTNFGHLFDILKKFNAIRQ
jgi:hypothetical protein